MDSALLVITEKLKETGMSAIEIDHLLARFLQEEAFDFVKYIHACMDEYDIKTPRLIQFNYSSADFAA